MCVLYCLMFIQSTFLCYIEGDRHDHDQDLVDKDALDHLEEEGHALLIIEGPGELNVQRVLNLPISVRHVCNVTRHTSLSFDNVTTKLK